MGYIAFGDLDSEGKMLCVSSNTDDRVLAASKGYAPEILSQDEGTPDLDPEGMYYRDPVEVSAMTVRARVAETGYWDWDAGFPWKEAPAVRKAGAEWVLRHPGEESDQRLRAGVQYELDAEGANYFRCACAFNGYFLDLFWESKRTLESWGGITEGRLCEDYLVKESLKSGSRIKGDSFDELYQSWLETALPERLWYKEKQR